ncbi:MAG TPA: YlxR family protein [Synergistaceae bacterium]|nr:YlxR family protein [Synergistaceae bacterium]HPJ25233.1 YlxR family protein [Synergistaceae bacterium]HPQ36104.1 YlxR family protein [Synergistaceae bacterium]
MTKRKRPRTCVGCGEENPRKSMFRIVRSPQGDVHYDPGGKMPGRGAYLCEDVSCILMAKKKKALSRALRTEVPPELYEELLREAARENPEEENRD